MMMRWSLRRVFLILVLVAVAAVRPQGIAAAPQTAANYVIGAQDVLLITILEDEKLNGKYTVEADGSFSFPLIGRVQAAGMTIRDFEGSLKAKLKDGYFVNPQVSVAVEQYRSQRVFITGEVRVPGMIPLTGGMTLVEALTRAGGATGVTSSGEVAIVRQKQPGKKVTQDGDEPIRVNLRDLETGGRAANVELQDGDTIYVLRAESLYVFGEVKSPGAHSVREGMTVLQALALAGGATPDAALNRIRIIRMEKGARKELNKVKLSELVKAGDTIIVPERYF